QTRLETPAVWMNLASDLALEAVLGQTAPDIVRVELRKRVPDPAQAEQIGDVVVRRHNAALERAELEVRRDETAMFDDASQEALPPVDREGARPIEECQTGDPAHDPQRDVHRACPLNPEPGWIPRDEISNRCGVEFGVALVPRQPVRLTEDHEVL